MTENKTIISIGFDDNGLPQASIEATGEPYERVIEDAKNIVEYLFELNTENEDIDELEEDDDPELDFA